MVKLKELEDECKGLIPTGSSQASINGASTITGRTANSSLSGSHAGNQYFSGAGNSGGNSSYYNNQGKNQSEFMVFKAITEK